MIAISQMVCISMLHLSKRFMRLCYYTAGDSIFSESGESFCVGAYFDFFRSVGPNLEKASVNVGYGGKVSLTFGVQMVLAPMRAL